MEAVLLRSILGFRAFQLVEAATSVRAAWPRLRHPWVSAGGVAVAAGELYWLATRCSRNGSLRDPAALWVDAATTAALLGASRVGAGEEARLDRAHWATAYGISSVAAAAAGLAHPTSRVAATGVIGVAYLSSVASNGRCERGPNKGAMVYNSLMYPGFLVAVSLIAARMRRTARQLRDSRDQAIEKVDGLAVQRERLRHQRLVHDSAVQTLQALSNLDTDDPSQVELARHQAQREAARLRRVLNGTEDVEAPDLSGALSDLAEDFAGRGLRVELVLDGLATDPAFDVVVALHEATRHALTRVSGAQRTTKTVVRATSDGHQVRVTIRDHPTSATTPDPSGDTAEVDELLEPKLLEATLTERLSLVGGVAAVRATPARGTRVDLTAPIDAPIDVGKCSR